MRKQLIPHPVLFAWFPCLFVYALNVEAFSPDVLLLPMVITTAFGLLCWLLLSLALRSREKAAVLLSLFLLLFFSYRYLGSAWPVLAGLYLLVAYSVIRTRRGLQAITTFLNVMVVTLVVFSLILIVEYQLGTRVAIKDYLVTPNPGTRVDTLLPNIYYIILDGYARADVLEQVYQFDNHDFLDSLEARGFYIASKSRANYSQTSLSLASSLNMQYLDDLTAQLGSESKNREPLLIMIQESRVFRFVKQHGYRLVAFATAHRPVDLKAADVYLAPPWNLDRFQVALIDTTPIPILLDRLTGGDVYEPHRKRLLYALDHLADPLDEGGPVFVFAHIWAPHPPFVFGEDGQRVNPQQSLTFADGTRFMKQAGLAAGEYQEHYRAQLAFVNQKMQAVVDAILAKASRPTVIVLQGDHGPGSGLEWEGLDPEASDLKERMAILNAYYLPAGRAEDPYDEISPVNTFRLIFNRYFGTEYKLLEDESYFSPWNRPYQFTCVGRGAVIGAR